MAEGLLRSIFGDRFEVHSAGTIPTKVNPHAINAMLDIGIDISDHRSKSISEFKDKKFDFVITVCDHAKETCPYFPGGGQYIHKNFKDPASYKGSEEEIRIFFTKIRDEIKDWIMKTFE
jgi:arsenate reductase